MPFPKRPRGEAPAVTIRWQRRQMVQMERAIVELRENGDGLREQIGWHIKKRFETETELFDMARRLDDVSVDLANTKAAARRNAERLAYLEGYHAKSQEARVQQTAVFPASRIIPSHQSNTYAGASAGNPQGLQARRQATESAGFDPGAAGFITTAGDQISSEPADHRTHPRERSMEYAEVARDGTTKWAAW